MYKMRLYLGLFLFAFFVLACTSEDQWSEVIESTSREFVPDKRVGIFDVKASKDADVLILSGESNNAPAVDSLVERLGRLGYVLKNEIRMLPDSGLYKAVVNVSVCNIRAKAKHSSELWTQALLGTSLNVYKRDGDWYYVQTPDGYLGWVDGGAIWLMGKLDYESWKLIPKLLYTSDRGLSYAKSDLSSPVVSDLLRGNLLLFKGKKGAFVRVGYPDGRVGFVPGGDLVYFDTWKSSLESNAENVLIEAKRYLGRPYLWGGTSPNGMDCSGFTKQVFYFSGYLLPRDASQQVMVGDDLGTDLDLSKFEKADLLFFGRKPTNTKKEKITHVAIYMGEGKIIHATGRVKIESLDPDDPLFAKDRFDSFVRAKRILGSKDVMRIGE